MRREPSFSFGECLSSVFTAETDLVRAEAARKIQTSWRAYKHRKLITFLKRNPPTCKLCNKNNKTSASQVKSSSSAIASSSSSGVRQEPPAPALASLSAPPSSSSSSLPIPSSSSSSSSLSIPPSSSSSSPSSSSQLSLFGRYGAFATRFHVRRVWFDTLDPNVSRLRIRIEPPRADISVAEVNQILNGGFWREDVSANAPGADIGLSLFQQHQIKRDIRATEAAEGAFANREKFRENVESWLPVGGAAVAAAAIAVFDIFAPAGSRGPPGVANAFDGYLCARENMAKRSMGNGGKCGGDGRGIYDSHERGGGMGAARDGGMGRSSRDAPRRDSGWTLGGFADATQSGASSVTREVSVALSRVSHQIQNLFGRPQPSNNDTGDSSSSGFRLNERTRPAPAPTPFPFPSAKPIPSENGSTVPFGFRQRSESKSTGEAGGGLRICLGDLTTPLLPPTPTMMMPAAPSSHPTGVAGNPPLRSRAVGESHPLVSDPRDPRAEPWFSMAAIARRPRLIDMDTNNCFSKISWLEEQAFVVL